MRATIGFISLRMPRGCSSHDHRSHARGRLEPPGPLVAGELDDHLDGSAHAHGLGAESRAGADRSLRDLFRQAHARVEAWLVALVGDEVEDLFHRPVDDDFTFYADHLAVASRAALDTSAA